MNPGWHYRFSNKTQFWQQYAWKTPLKSIKLFRLNLHINIWRIRAIDCKSYWTEISKSFAFVAAFIEHYQRKSQAGYTYYHISNNKKNIVKSPAFLFLLLEQTLKGKEFWHNICTFYLKWNIECLSWAWRSHLQTDVDL